MRNNNWTDRTPSPENTSRSEAEMRLKNFGYDAIMRQERNKKANSRVGDSIPLGFGNILSIIGWLVFRAIQRNKS